MIHQLGRPTRLVLVSVWAASLSSPTVPLRWLRKTVGLADQHPRPLSRYGERDIVERHLMLYFKVDGLGKRRIFSHSRDKNARYFVQHFVPTNRPKMFL